jgi:E3 ubiquitin-protein ligase RNF11
MGNCLEGSREDDIPVLRGGDGTRDVYSTDQLGPRPPYQEGMPVYCPSPIISQPAGQLTEEEQIKMAKRIGLIELIPTAIYDGGELKRECVICMIEFMKGDAVRYLPCFHIYHAKCIDDWLLRSFSCPSCMEPVDAAFLIS